MYALCQRYAVQNNTDQLGAYVLSGIHKFIFVQRDHCARDVLAGNIDGHSAGRGGVFRICRRERPLGLIAVACVGLDRAVLPRERTLDLRVVGIFHLARDGALAQLVAVGDLRCGDFAICHGRDFVHRVEIDWQSEVLVVVRDDFDRDCSDFAGYPLLRCLNRQRQDTVFNLRSVFAIDCIPIFKIKNNHAIDYLAVFALGRGGQQLLGVIGVFQLRAVDHVQAASLDIRGRVGLADGSGLLIRAVRERVVRHGILQRDRAGDRLCRVSVRIRKRTGNGVVLAHGQSIAAAKAVKRHTFDRRCRRTVVGLFCDPHRLDRQFLLRDGHGFVLNCGFVVINAARNLVVNPIRPCIGTRGNLLSVLSAARKAIHHRAVLGVQRPRCDKLLRLAGVGQAGLGRWRGNLGSRNAGLFDGQLFFVARHRIAVLGSCEINIVGSHLVEGVVRDVVPAGADLLILTRILGVAVTIGCFNVEDHRCAACIAVGAKQRFGATVYGAGNGLVISDLHNRQRTARNGQALDGDIGQFRGFGGNVRRGVPRIAVQVGIVRVHLVAGVSGKKQDIFPRCTLRQRQFFDDSGGSRNGELCVLVSDDLLNGACALGV